MRFNSPDRISPFERGGINAYAYCEGSPVNWQDHSGSQRSKAGSMHDLRQSGALSDVSVRAMHEVFSYAKSVRKQLSLSQLDVEGRVGDAEYFLDIARRDKRKFEIAHHNLLAALVPLEAKLRNVQGYKSRVEGGIKKLSIYIGKVDVEMFKEPSHDSGMIPFGESYEGNYFNYSIDSIDSSGSNDSIPYERPRLGTWPSSKMGEVRQ